LRRVRRWTRCSARRTECEITTKHQYENKHDCPQLREFREMHDKTLLIDAQLFVGEKIGA
jgi:hypothetical protein